MPATLAALPPTRAAPARPSSLCFAKNLLYQRLKTRLVANAVVDLVDLKIPTSAVLLLVSFFQPIQTFFFLAKSKVYRRECCGTNVLSLRQFFEFAQRLLGFRSISRNSIRVTEEPLIPGTGIRSFGFF